MKLQFKKQQFQIDAVESVAKLLVGQDRRQDAFTISNGLFETLGYANTLTIDSAQIEKNMQAVQVANKLKVTTLTNDELRFNIEMETGTGKTYVYTQTILELNKRYGFNKFIILVPSIAIREGVFKSMQTTREHFRREYDGVALDPFIYNSAKLNEVRDFAESPNLEVMIINIDAFKKSENLFNQINDRKMVKPAKEYVRECRPIIIIDEPQSVDRTSKDREAIESLNPLMELRYSATHREKINTLYRLTPVDAYQQGIVKQIVVANTRLVDDFNKPYIKLISVEQKGGFSAKIEVDIKDKKTGVVSRKTITVKPNADLEFLTDRDIYRTYDIDYIDCTAGSEHIGFVHGHKPLALGESIGSFDEMSFKREQIKRTIETHLDKELVYLGKKIKVLSLFFVDEVKKYRDYDRDDKKGVYAQMFESAYNELIVLPKYAELREFFKHQTEQVHGGYFSQDKKGVSKDTRGDTADDVDTYSLIMREKEMLLSFATPLRFIWSHSALKEGWDNSNVFQICTLIENKTTFTARQKIGRGLRLCVDQTGTRIDDKRLNILHIIAQESFAEFADKLQKEIEEETGVKFGIIDIENFIGYTYEVKGETKTITHTEATKLVTHLREANYIDSKGKAKPTLKTALESGAVDLPSFLEPARERIVEQLKQADRRIVVKDASKQVSVKRRDELFADPRFVALWNKIKQKTIYRIDMKIATLIANCIKEITEMDPIRAPQIAKTQANIDVQKSGVVATETISPRFASYKQENALPDVLRELGTNTQMPRKDIAKILFESDRIADFARNPQRFIEVVTDIIQRNKSKLSIDGLKYSKVEGQEYSMFKVFDLEDTKTIIGFLEHNAVAMQNENNTTLYDHIIYDSATVERPFAEALDKDDDVQFFFKIPERFKIDTPIGSYTPDWAVYVKNDKEENFYFVIETKGTTDYLQHRTSEHIKYSCGKKHFEALGTDIAWAVDSKWANIKKNRA